MDDKYSEVARELVAARGKIPPGAVGTLAGLVVGGATANPLLAGVAAGGAEAFASALTKSATKEFLAAGTIWDEQQELIERIAEHLRVRVTALAEGRWQVVLPVLESELREMGNRADENFVSLAKLVVSMTDRSVAEQREASQRIEATFVGVQAALQQRMPTAPHVVAARIENFYLGLPAAGAHSGASTASSDNSPVGAPNDAVDSSAHASNGDLSNGGAAIAARASTLMKRVQVCVNGNEQLLRFCGFVAVVFGLAGLFVGLGVTTFSSRELATVDRFVFAAGGTLTGLGGALSFLSVKPNWYWAATMYRRGKRLLRELSQFLGLGVDGSKETDVLVEAESFHRRCEERCSHG